MYVSCIIGSHTEMHISILSMNHSQLRAMKVFRDFCFSIRDPSQELQLP